MQSIKPIVNLVRPVTEVLIKEYPHFLNYKAYLVNYSFLRYDVCDKNVVKSEGEWKSVTYRGRH